MTFLRHAFLGSMIALLAGAAWGQNSASLPAASPASASAYVPPLDLIRAASANELKAANETSPRHSFRSVKRNAQGSQTRLYVQTSEAIAGITVAHDDHLVTPQEMQSDEDHLNYLAHDAGARRAKHAHELEELDRTRRILKALPDAFVYDYDGVETGTAEIGGVGLKLTRLRFRPNPNYSPPSRIEQVLTGMTGTILVDVAQRRLALFDATLVRDVGFGWGFLGRLDKGGVLQLRQTTLSDGTWELNRLHMQFTGKILIFKSLNVNSDEVLDQFKPVPANTTFAQAVDMLRSERTKLLAAAPATPTHASH
jgi:hypothetical protein